MAARLAAFNFGASGVRMARSTPTTVHAAFAAPSAPLAAFKKLCRLFCTVDAGLYLHSTARLAQSVERKALNLVVVGSSPTVGVFLTTLRTNQLLTGCNMLLRRPSNPQKTAHGHARCG